MYYVFRTQTGITYIVNKYVLNKNYVYRFTKISLKDIITKT